MESNIIELELNRKVPLAKVASPRGCLASQDAPSPPALEEVGDLLKSFYNSTLTELPELQGFRTRLEVAWPSLASGETTAPLGNASEGLRLLGEAWDLLPLWIRQREDHFREMIEKLAASLASTGPSSEDFHRGLEDSTVRLREITGLEDLREIKYRILSEADRITLACQVHQKAEAASRGDMAEHIQQLQTELQQAEQRAALDPLTRAANRGSLDAALARWARRPIRSRCTFVLGLFDIDDFKRINDSYGHPVGDRVLIAAVKVLRNAVRTSDLLARYGGEEFAVLLDGVTAEQAEAKFSATLNEMAAVRYYFEKDGSRHTVQFTASCGVAEFSPGENLEDLVARADAALYQAKRRGKNRAEVRHTSAFQALLRKVRGVGR